MLDYNLKGKVALITGGGQGIGREIAIALAEQGVKIIVVDVIEENADKVKDEIIGMGIDAISFCVDVSEQVQVNKMVDDSVKHYGRIDILINNAGISSGGITPRVNRKRVPIIEMDPLEWQKVININLNGMFYTAQACAKVMVKQNYGKVINMSSVAGRTYGPVTAVHYMTSKTGVIGLTRSMAGELGPYGLNVNAIAPGRIKTDLIGDVNNEINKSFLKKIPVGRLGTTRDISNAALFLVSDRAGFINGATLDINGGSHII